MLLPIILMNLRVPALVGLGMVIAATTALAGGIYPGFDAATTLTGNETAAWDTNLTGGRAPQTELVTVDQLYAGELVTDSTAGAITGTAAQFSGHALMFVRLTGAISGGTNVQLPTAAAMFSEWGEDGATDKCWFVKVVNAAGTGSGVWTVTTNTGLTLAGNMTVAVAGSRLLKLCFTSATAATVTDYGN